MKTYSSEPLERFAYYPQGDGTAIVLLRDNIEQDAHDESDGSTVTFWQADEVVVRTDLPLEAIDDEFDVLWVRAEAEAKPLAQRVRELEELLDATIAVVLGEDEED